MVAKLLPTNAGFRNHLKRFLSTSKFSSSYDAIVIGGGHNGLVTACYLAMSGLKVCVFERRPILGGAAVTEEIVPGFKFSRASYLLSLFRPIVMEELKLKENGLQYYIKDPASFTPIRNSKSYLLLGSDAAKNRREIAKFSSNDAEKFEVYEALLNEIVEKLEPLLDKEPPDFQALAHGSLRNRMGQYLESLKLLRIVSKLGLRKTMTFYEFMTSPISKILDQWFESEPLRATLATDGIIGSALGPHAPGTGYVLLHHVMGELDGKRGAWAFVRGGMGAVSQTLAKVASQLGVTTVTDAEVSELLCSGSNVKGVVLQDGSEIHSSLVLSNATPRLTFLKLCPKTALPSEFLNSVKAIDYQSPVTKINVALTQLPNFSCLPNLGSQPMSHHGTTIHLNTENIQTVQQAYVDYVNGQCSTRPMIEMTIPSSRDVSLAPSGFHVALLFTQYTPYHYDWNKKTKTAYAQNVFKCIDEYCPGFSSSIVDYEILTPPDLEQTFGLTGGNIFHGSLSLDQLYFARPVPFYANYRTPIKGLYLCGSGAHPGGGVTGGPGRLAALAALKDRRRTNI